MDGNSAKKAPVLDHLVDKLSAKTSNATSTAGQKKASNMPLWATANDSGSSNATNDHATANGNEPSLSKPTSLPQNRRTDKSKFEIELTKTVHEIMLKHFENASEEIVQQVLNEVRARLPGQKKS